MEVVVARVSVAEKALIWIAVVSGRAAASGHARPELDPHPESVMLVGAVTGIANGLLAGTFTKLDARNSLQYAIELSLPGG